MLQQQVVAKDQEIVDLQSQLKQKVLEQVQTSFKLKMIELEKAQAPAVGTDYEALSFKCSALEQELRSEKENTAQYKELRTAHTKVQEDHIQLQRESHELKQIIEAKTSEVLELK